MKKLIILLVLLVSWGVSKAQQEIHYVKVDTCKVQLVVSKSEVIVHPVYGDYFGETEWNMILDGQRKFESLEEVSEILSLFDFTVTCMEWEKEDLIIDLEKYARTTITITTNERG